MKDDPRMNKIDDGNAQAGEKERKEKAKKPASSNAIEAMSARMDRGRAQHPSSSPPTLQAPAHCRAVATPRRCGQGARDFQKMRG